MNSYVPPNDRKAVRRRRRAVEGPAGDEPPELEPARIARVLRCPKCRYTLSTMRRWRLRCSECGHEWEEETVLATADRVANLRAAVGEYVVIALMWGGLVTAFGIVLGVPFVLLYIVANAADWTIGFTVVAGLVMVAVALGIARHIWRSEDSALRGLRGPGRGDDPRFR